MNRARGLMVVAGSAAALVVAGSAQAAPLVNSSHIVAYAGGPAPGVDVDETFAFVTNPIGNPQLSDAGRVSFDANISGPNVVNANRLAFFQQDGTGTLQMIARSGALVPGFAPADNVRFQSATLGNGLSSGSFRVTSSGKLIFAGQYSGTGIITTGTGADINNSGIFTAIDGVVTQAIRRGELVPGNPALKFNSAFTGLSTQSLCANDSGAVSFVGDLRNADNTALPTTSNQAYFAGIPGGAGATGLTMVLRKGDLPFGAGTSPVLNFQFINQINANGQAVFNTRLTQGTFGSEVINAHNDGCTWVYTPGSGYSLLARESQPVAAAGGSLLDNATFFNGSDGASVSACGFNAAGQAAFHAEFVTGSGDTDASNNTAVCRWDATNGIQIVARKGAAVPSVPDAILSSINSSFDYMNTLGVVSFQAFLSGPGIDTTNDFVLCYGTPGNFQLAVREATPFPELGPDVTASPKNNQTHFFNALNQFVFPALLAGTGITTANDDCFMAWGPNTGLMLLWREGDTLTVAPMDTRTYVGTTGGNQFNNGNGRQLIFADSGRLATRAFFADNSNVALSVLIPNCVADVDDGAASGNPDGGVTIDDLLYYLALFEAGDIRSDVDNGSFTGTKDGGVTIDDLLYFLFRFESGC